MGVLMEAAFKTKKNNYAHIIEAMLGKKAGIFLHIVFIITTFGVTTIYLITAATFTPKILTQLGVEHDTANSNETRIFIIIGITIAMYPLFL